MVAFIVIAQFEVIDYMHWLCFYNLPQSKAFFCFEWFCFDEGICEDYGPVNVENVTHFGFNQWLPIMGPMTSNHVSGLEFYRVTPIPSHWI